MYKLLLLFIISFGVLYAEDKVEIYATNIANEGSIINASGEIAVVYKDYYLSASRASYNKDNGVLELFENVRANQRGQYKILGNYAKINLQNKEKSFQPFYMFEQESQVWISGESCGANGPDFNITSGVVSGCDPSDPLWQIEFSSSDYNTESKWMNLYNARLYIYDIPVFYTPWFGYPLDKTRRTGLLKPSLGLSSTEGFYFQQPIYIAEYDSWDLELDPQIRTKRGEGIYSTFRFADSPFSHGSITTGYFKEKNDYFLANNLANDSHYGYNIKYENSDVLNQWLGTSLEGQSGLYVDGNFMNDVDYINLASNETINVSTATQVLSRANLFYNTDRNYYGTYFKNYLDLTKDSNDDTLQKLPTAHYHHYLETLLDEHITYNIDMQSNNLHREINKKVVQTNFNIPVSIHTTLFDEYLDVDYTTNLYAQHSSFGGSERIPSGIYEDGYIARNDNVISVSTQLTKAYDEFSHVMGFGSSYRLKGAETTTGFYAYNKEFCKDPINANHARCDFYAISEVKEELKLNFSQYVYDALGTQKLYHRLSQNVLFTGFGSSKGDLENELEYLVLDGFEIYSNVFYSHKEDKFSKLYNKLAFNYDDFDLALSHLYQDTFIPSVIQYANYVTSYAKYRYSKQYSYHFAYDYDVELKKEKRTEVGFLYSKRCWDFGLKFVQNNRPVLDATGNTHGIKEKYVYFTISLKPFMSTGSTDSSLFAYKLPED